jgi:outer membrane protein OmpA-like peptidoglycan-associated protein
MKRLDLRDSGALGAAVAAAAAVAIFAGTAQAQSLVRMGPVECRGQEVVVVQYRLIETDGVAIHARGQCSVSISDSRIVAGTVAIQAAGQAVVEIEDSFVSGGEAAIRAAGQANVSFGGSTLHGVIHTTGNARARDQGGNTRSEAAAAQPSRPAQLGEATPPAPGDAEIRIDPGAVDIRGPAGEQVQIGPGGIVVRESGDEVRIGPGGEVQVEERGRGTTVAIGREGTAVDIADDHGRLVRLDEAGRFVVAEGDSLVAGEGGWVSIRHGDQAVDVHPGPGTTDWRHHPGSVHIRADAGTLVAELGAVEREGQLHLQLAGDVMFDFDSAAIRPDSTVTLAQVAALARQRGASRIEVVGHTDSLGRDDYNMELSRQRAVAVMMWLHEREGIPASLLAGRGVGAQQPIAHNTRPDGSDDPEGRARNRRVEIRIH